MEIDTLSIVLNQITNTLAMLAKDISEVRVQLASGSSNSTLDNMQINHHLEKIENDLTIARNAIEDLRVKEVEVSSFVNKRQVESLTKLHNIEVLLNRVEAQMQEERELQGKLDYTKLAKVTDDIEEALSILQDKKKQVLNKVLFVIILFVIAGLIELLFGKIFGTEGLFKGLMGLFN